MPTPFFSPEIYAAYSVFNEDLLLYSSLLSVLPYVDGVVILDGAYRDYPSESRLSNDETVGIVEMVEKKLENHDIYFIYHEAPDLTESEKRSLFFQLAPEGVWLLVIDGDELLVGKTWLFPMVKYLRCEVAWLQVAEKGSVMWRPRLIRVRRDYRYYPNHWTVCDSEGKIVTDSVNIKPWDYKVSESYIVNLFWLREAGRRDARSVYREKMSERGWCDFDLR